MNEKPVTKIAKRLIGELLDHEPKAIVIFPWSTTGMDSREVTVTVEKRKFRITVTELD